MRLHFFLSALIAEVTDEIKSTNSGNHNKSIIIYNEWNYIAFAIENQLYLSGFLGVRSNQLRQLQFEQPIKDICSTNKLCIVLLMNGSAYKIDLERFIPIELNPLMIKPLTSNTIPRTTSIFGGSNVSDQIADNEFITHIASGRSLCVAITNKNAVYNVPLKVFTFPSHVKIKKISCGIEHCLILTTNGDLYTFGSSS